MKPLFLLICITLGVFGAQAQFDSTVTIIDSTDYQFSEKWHRLYENVPTDSATIGYFIDKMVC